MNKTELGKIPYEVAHFEQCKKRTTSGEYLNSNHLHFVRHHMKSMDLVPKI